MGEQVGAGLISKVFVSAGMPDLRSVIPRLRRLCIKRRQNAYESKLSTRFAVFAAHLLNIPGLIAQPVRAHA